MNQSHGLVAELEKNLVMEFRSLQDLAALTSQERETMPAKDLDTISALVEQKEKVLDKLNLLLDRRRLLIQQTSCALGAPNEDTSIQDLLPYLNPGERERITHLIDGTVSLVTEVRNMNYGNSALANSLLAFVHSAQAMMIDLLQKQIDYGPAGSQTRAAVINPVSFDHRV